MKVLILLSAFVAVTLATQRRYDGYQVYEVKAKDEAGYNILVKIATESSIYDFWTVPRGLDHSVDVMVPPAFTSQFLGVLDASNIQHRIKIPDVQASIGESKEDAANNHGKDASPRYSVTWDEYYEHSAIMAFVDEIAAEFPQLVTVEERGRSYEGRRMPMLKISSNSNMKKAIFVDGGIHAREWISPAFTTWLIHELVVNYANHTELVDDVDWYIMPVINPDGYEFSRIDDRLWRKNRRPNPGFDNCTGTDMNRNFGFHWDEGGSTDSPCTGIYNGGAPFSEIESQIVRDAILSVAPDTLVYLSFHSYGEHWLTPWSYTVELPEDYEDLRILGQEAADAIETVFGTMYDVGSATNVLYVSSGGSDDWAKGGAGIKYSYTVEMRDDGTYGFRLPPEQILPNNLEVWEGVKVIANFVAGQSKKN